MPKIHELKITSLPLIWNKETTIPLTQYDTVAEAVKAGHFKDEASVLASANATRNVRLNRLFRETLEEKPTTTKEELRVLGEAFTYGERAERAAGQSTVAKAAVSAVTSMDASAFDVSKMTPEQIAALRALGVKLPDAPAAGAATGPARRPAAAPANKGGQK